MNNRNLFLSYKLDLRSLNKLVAFQNLSVSYTLKNIRQQYKKQQTSKKSTNIK